MVDIAAMVGFFAFPHRGKMPKGQMGAWRKPSDTSLDAYNSQKITSPPRRSRHIKNKPNPCHALSGSPIRPSATFPRWGKSLFLSFALLTLPLPAYADIFVGVAGPMNGQFAGFGNQMKAGVETAVADINAAGGINGEKLAVVIGDDSCDTKKAVDVAKDFVGKDVRLVVGHFCSGASLAAALVYQASGIIMITPAASQPVLTEKALWNVFRITGRDDGQAAIAAARLAAENPTGNIAVVSDATPANAALAARFKLALAKATLFAVKPGAGNFADVTAGVSNNAVAALYLAMAPGDAGRLATELRSKGFLGSITGADGLLAEAYGTRAAAAAENTLATFPTDPTTLPTAFQTITNMRLKSIEPDGATLPSYGAVQVFLAAAKARSVNNGRAMADWLRGGQAIATVLGDVKFDAKGDLLDQPFIWYRWNGGAFAPEKQ